MKKKLQIMPVLLMLLVVMMYKPLPTAACSCMAPPAADIALTEATAVFSGEVIEVTKNTNEGKTISFNVDNTWKGIDSTTTSVFTGNDSASCGIDFIVGEKYLVYAHTIDSSGKSILTTTLCDRTAELANAADDLLVIGEGQIPTQTEQPTDAATIPYYLYAGIAVAVGGLIGLLLWKRSKKK